MRSILSENTKYNEINWDEPQILISGSTNLIVLSTGTHEAEYFTGTLIKPSNEYQIGTFAKNWRKSNFTRLEPQKKVILSNDYD